MNDAHQRSECGTLVRRILVPLYRVRDTYPAFDRALQVAQMFEAGLLIAAVVDKGSFTVLGGAPAAGGPVVATDRKHLALSRAELTRQIRFLAEQANELGVQAETTAVVGSASDEVVQLSRRCDLIVECELHRPPFLERVLFRTKDPYTHASCPVLVARGEAFVTKRVLLVYNRTEQANRALRWVALLAKTEAHTDLHALVIFRNEKERERLPREVVSLAAARGLDVQAEAVPANIAFERAIDSARAFRPSLVAMPTYAFSRPLRLRLQGINRQALEDLEASVLLFA